MKLLVIASLLVCSNASAKAPPEKATEVNRKCVLCLYGPDNIAFDRQDNLYLVDTDHKTQSRILKLSPDGSKRGEWKIFSQSSSRRNGPEGIAIDHKGDILVTDAGTNKILKVSPSGKIRGQFGGASAIFSDLGHIAVLSDGRVVVSEAGPNRIQVFSPKGRRLSSWIRPRGADADSWNGPESIAVLGVWALAVEDWGNHRIEVVSKDGRTIGIIAHPGQGYGEIMNSAGVATDPAGHVYVADYASKKIVEFNRDGSVVREIRNSPANMIFQSGPGGIAVGSDGNLFSPDGLSVVEFSAEGHLIARWQ